MKPVDTLGDDEFAHLVHRAAALPDAPPWLVSAAIDLWPAGRGAALKSVAESAWRLVGAVLTFDSWAHRPGALGMRAAASDMRHLLFSAQGRDIDLRISPAAGHYVLTGQILGPDEAGVVELDTPCGDGLASGSVRVAALDSMGEFRLDRVLAGTYRLSLRLGGDQVVLPPIVVGERPA